MTYLRSSSTAFRTSADSALTSALIGKLRLTRIFLDLKSNKEKEKGNYTEKPTQKGHILGFKSY